MARTAASGSGVSSLHTFTEDELMMKEAATRFAHDKIKPLVAQMDDSEIMDPSIFTGLFEQGFMGIEVPEQYGGAGSSFTSAMLVVEEIAKIDPSVATACDVHNTLVNTTLNHHASEYIKETYLSRLATTTVGSFGLTEAGAGSDAFALKSTAVKKGDYYVLNGHKMWISNSGEADIFVIFATVDPSKGYKGITAFVVDKSMGIQIAKKERKLGIRASSTCMLTFDDLKVPATNVIGTVGHGYKYAIEVLNEGRIGIAAQMVGAAQGAFDVAVAYAMDRKQFGRAVGEFQGMQHQIAQVAVEIEAARLLTYNAARLKEESKPFVKEAAMAKLFAAQVAERATSKAVEWMGGVGFSRESGVEKFYRDSKIGAIYEGTSNIQLQTIAKVIQAQYKK
ncbi:acyl-CoA dehydrogenase/oxidase [Blastocladiella britannica]|nr:acyl-CoA dehydrogenase/oxidase [Blastocladiella britannica]